MKSIEVLRKKTIAYKVDRFLLMHKKNLDSVQITIIPFRQTLFDKFVS